MPFRNGRPKESLITTPTSRPVRAASPERMPAADASGSIGRSTSVPSSGAFDASTPAEAQTKPCRVSAITSGGRARTIAVASARITSRRRASSSGCELDAPVPTARCRRDERHGPRPSRRPSARRRRRRGPREPTCFCDQRRRGRRPRRSRASPRRGSREAQAQARTVSGEGLPSPPRRSSACAPPPARTPSPATAAASSASASSITSASIKALVPPWPRAPRFSRRSSRASMAVGRALDGAAADQRADGDARHACGRPRALRASAGTARTAPSMLTYGLLGVFTSSSSAAVDRLQLRRAPGGPPPRRRRNGRASTSSAMSPGRRTTAGTGRLPAGVVDPGP